MWRTPRDLLPEEELPVAVWENDELSVAMQVGGEWYSCSAYGDVQTSNGGGPIMCDPKMWCHLPVRLVKPTRKKT